MSRVRVRVHALRVDFFLGCALGRVGGSVALIVFLLRGAGNPYEINRQRSLVAAYLIRTIFATRFA